jgi:stage II sporulation protein E
VLRRTRHPDLADVNVYTARRLTDLAQSLGLLAKTCQEDAGTEQGMTREDALSAMQQAAAMVCGSCSRCNLYRDSTKQDSYYLYYLLRTFEQKGYVDSSDMPRYFLESCGSADEYLRQLNRNLGRACMNLEWKNRFYESRDTVMLQFREMATILEEFAHQMEQAKDITAVHGEAVRRGFRTRHMMVENLLLLEYENAHREALVTVRTTDGKCVTAKDAAGLLGRVMGGRSWYAPRDTRALITRQTATVRFVEGGIYQMAYGIAATPRQGENTSGDSYTYSGSIPGQVLMNLSDGMGSGNEAAAQSRRVVELTQQLLETGFSARAALKMVNTILLLSGDAADQRPATLDLACVDLHTGVMEMMKMGAPASFVLGEEGVEILQAAQIPAGVMNQTEPSLLTRKLWDGERVIMMTDGILDACPGDRKEQTMSEYLASLPAKSPQDMAERILDFACQNAGGSRDDMTVLVAGIWKKELLSDW